MKFLSNVKEEMKKVTWPSGKQLRKDTIIVVETSLVFALLFYVMDTGIQTIFSWILK
ncbi:preprotein translocase subunit SecE [Enterococcus aquimarinus]|jgi:preprotein translocase subunit SecE|uniref:Protein translocase subunit SecE n=1 Tax=Enterococcus aquimarinus TaxID=328396 RepID=A0A1L8QNE7_9ENTE|nr:preprotein translocase subunit SecE [Enterococcus aquimarinus]MBP9521400.1 preprotein translocase subunit SecE [Enterococcus sp.]HRM13404.1 preprotein translocase subunit SecE [Flavobacterium sp.]MCC9273519.1 preprotein translocase subunit SecE [Enterococcus aquimarinus]OJG09022.1 preprotein translocase subunit SecE [Enterococcus aquimarinus]HRL51257.1 preprotein translocase subunit SecE [Enterococcus aquimarinus]